jgi:hypothetical protein
MKILTLTFFSLLFYTQIFAQNNQVRNQVGFVKCPVVNYSISAELGMPVISGLSKIVTPTAAVYGDFDHFIKAVKMVRRKSKKNEEWGKPKLSGISYSAKIGIENLFHQKGYEDYLFSDFLIGGKLISSNLSFSYFYGISLKLKGKLQSTDTQDPYSDYQFVGGEAKKYNCVFFYVGYQLTSKLNLSASFKCKWNSKDANKNYAYLFNQNGNVVIISYPGDPFVYPTFCINYSLN